MATITIIGKYCYGYDSANGQSIKTRILTRELEEIFGQENINQIETYRWKKHPLQLMLKCVRAVWGCKHVIFMTDEGGIRVFPLLLTLANVARRCKLHYVVIGGWLPRTIGQRRVRRFLLKRLHRIYVETNTMKAAMEANGFTNIVLMPNFKRLSICPEVDLPHFTSEPLRLCTFSRVMKEKGIEDAVRAVDEINHRHGRQLFTLDIYGEVDALQVQWFEELQQRFPEGVRYGGVIPSHQSAQALKDCFALLFPTHFYTEGVPGTIIDAFSAGVPVISARWESYDDILDDETCLSYPFGSYEGLVGCLEQAAANPELINSKRAACLQQAQLYTPEHVMHVLLEQLDGCTVHH